MKVGVAGQGAFGVKHIEAIKNIPGIEIITLTGGNQAATEEVAKEVQHSALDWRSGREPEAAGSGSRDSGHAHANARRSGRTVHARRQARTDRNSDGRFAGGFRAHPEGAKGDRPDRYGGPHAPLQSQPSVDPQAHHGRRVEGPADERADVLFPAHQYECRRQAAQLDGSSAVAPRLPYRGSVRVSDRAKTFPNASRWKGRTIRN